MNGLSPELVAIIRSEKKGAWLKKFDESVEIINVSAAQDAWVLRGSVKAGNCWRRPISTSSRRAAPNATSTTP